MVKGKIKKKRWAKHGSCLSNPDHKRFREAATVNRTVFKPSGPSALTEDTLKTLENGGGQVNRPIDAQSYYTWCTNFTDCTNVTFNKAHKLVNSNKKISKDILSVLAMLTEVIKENGGTGTETEYFAGLLSMLDREDEDDVAAATVLMDMAVNKIQASTLQGRFSQVSKALTEALVKHSQTENTTLLKHLLRTLAVVLKAQEAASWNMSSTTNTFRLLLQFTLSTKPRVRKTARQSVKTVLMSNSPADLVTFHPAAVPAAEFCISTLKQNGRLGAAEIDGLHVLNLLQEVLYLFPPKELKSSCETLLQFMFINKPVIKSNALAALHGMFEKHPQARALPADLNSRIINALYDRQPTENDSGLMPAWLAVMEQAHLNLFRLDSALCMGHLPGLLTVGMKCLLAGHRDIQTCARNMMDLLLKECVGPQTAPECLGKVVNILEGGLSFQYSTTWNMVLPLLGTLMEVAGKVAPDLLKKCLSSLAGLRDSHSFGYKGEVDEVVSRAVKSMGPEPVLQAVPLRMTGNEDNPDLSRSWLLPVLRDNVSNTQLSFFTSYFLPLAMQFKTKGQQLASQGREAMSKTYQMLELQVWSLLKGFCTCPTDLAKSFKGTFAMQLGNALKERQDLQLDVMAALRSMVNFSKNNEEDKAAMARLAQNYLPLLFNLFTSEPEAKDAKDSRPRDGRRLAALETVKVFLTIADSQLINKYMDTCNKLMAKEDTSAFKKIALIDLLMSMVKHVGMPHLTSMYNLAKDNIQSSDKTLQKKAYRVLEELCVCQSEDCRQFLASHLHILQNLLLGNDSLAAAAPSTKNPRLRCLTHVCEQLTEPNTEFIQAVLPEAMLCTRGCGERARAAAYHLIDAIGRRMLAWNPEQPKQDVLHQYVNIVLAGLSGSSQMICATLLALTRILSTYRDCLSGDTLSKVIQIVCQLMTSAQREIVRAALDFVKIFISVYQRDLLCAHLSEMMSGVSSMKETTRRPCHIIIKQIFKKLIKKFGFEAVQKLASPKVLVVLQKANSELKQEKKKMEKKASARGHDDSDDDDDEHVKAKPETLEEILFDDDDDDDDDDLKKTKRSAFIVEGGGEVVDILHHSSAKKVMASRPKSSAEKTASTKEKDGGFKIAPDGRLIITDTDEKKQGEKMDSDEENLDDLLTMIEGGSDKKRRKRLREEAEHKEGEAQKKYKPGGSGIHRPLTKERSDFGAEYRSKKGTGDVKKVGKQDPYAYVPLEFKNLNKRKQAKLKGQFSGLVKGARKGALKGIHKSRAARKAAQKHAAKK